MPGPTSGKRSRTHESYHNMTQRCLNQNRWDYPLYGGRGIAICDRWMPRPAPDGTGYRNFLADMGHRPPDLTLERIDNNGNYEPGNCRWASRARQTQNSRKAKLSWAEVEEIRSMAHLDLDDLAERFGISEVQVSNILRNKSWRVPVVTWDAPNRMRRLDASDVALIRMIEGRTHQSIADEFGVDKSTVTRIRNGKLYASRE